MIMKTYKTNYKVAIDWCKLNLVLCNNIAEIDPTVWENLGKQPQLEEEEEDWGVQVAPDLVNEYEVPENEDYEEEEEEEDEPQIYQWYITSANKDTVEYLSKRFGLWFTYSDLLDCYVLCVTHWGTGWDYVDWVTTNPIAARHLGESAR